MTKPVWRDPIVEEVRRLREAYAARFHHDLDAIVEDLRKVQAQVQSDGFTIVSLSPKRPVKKTEAA